MGQKVNPKIFRIGIIDTWNSKWFSVKNYQQYLREDVVIKKYLRNKLREAMVAKIDVERSQKSLTIIIHTAKPGVIIGRGGAGIEELKKEIKNKFLRDKKTQKYTVDSLNINIFEVDKPNLSATILMQQVITDLEKRVLFRRAVKGAIGRAEKAGALGVKIIVAGRLNGAEIARDGTLFSGKLPLQTLRADIDYARGAAQTIYGKIGVKVWVYKGELFAKETKDKEVKEFKEENVKPKSRSKKISNK
ncbi:MAG: 30S ribosomal protein S3 [Candidatus Buchananbacteria bacterium]